jgi:FkbM family methyltransferase
MFKFLQRRKSPGPELSQGAAPRELATAEDIRACFRLLLGREPNSEEWPGHSARAGEKLATVVRSFLHSKEFAERRLLQTDDLQSYEFASVGDLKVAAAPSDLDVGKHVLAGHYEPHVTSVFQREIREGMYVLDVGANCGYFSFLALGLTGKSGHVWAVEPNAGNARLLEISKRANCAANLTIVPAAAGTAFGSAKLNASQSNGMVSQLTTAIEDASSATLVCQIALDSIFLNVERLDFIKIDVEGAEYVALKGLEQTLRRCHPKIVSEFSPGTMPGISGVTGAQYLDFLLQTGYQLGVIAPDGQVHGYHRSAAPILEAFRQSGVDHIDFLAVPASAQ